MQTPDGIATTPLEKAEALNDTFKSVFTPHDSSPLPTMPTSTYPSLPKVDNTEQGVFISCSTRTRNDTKFLHCQPSIDCFRYSFFPRTIPEWNKLPQYIVNADSIESLKELLYGHYNIM